MKRYISLILAVLMAAFVSACGDTVSEQSDGPNDEIPPESVINAQKLINDGKFAEAYAILYADRENEDAKAMLEKFAVVPTVTDCKNYTQYNYFRETAFNEQGDAISLTIIDPLVAGQNRETHIKYENTYDEKGNLIKVVELDMDYNSETVTEYEYDALNRPVKIIEDWRTTEKVYDEAGNVITETITDDAGYTYIHEYTYDERGNKLTYSATFDGKDDVSEEYSYEYNDKGDIVKFTEIYFSSPEDSRDTLYEYTYDEEGRKTKTVTTLHVGSSITDEFEYNDRGDITKIVNTSPVLTTVTEYEYTYGKGGEIEKEKMVKYSWSESAATDAYDSHGNITLHQYNDSSTKNEYTYDENGFIVKKVTVQTDAYSPNGKKTISEYTHDEKGNILKIVSKENGGSETLTEFIYDSENRILKETRTKVRGEESEIYYVDEFTYDNFGNILTKYHKYYQNESSAQYEYVYDENGNMLEKRKDGEPSAKYTYDENKNCLTVETYENGKYYLSTENSYDFKGNLIKSVRYDENGILLAQKECLFDEKGKLLKESVTKGAAAGDFNVYEYTYEYTYDELGNKLTFLSAETNITGHQVTIHEYTYSGYEYFYLG